jgi:3-oxoacyl-[acyl-carrier protein] reductase
MDLQLTGKRALITGASRGLGFAAAKLLATEGADVAINSRDAGKLSAAASQIGAAASAQVIPIPGDITDPLFPAALIAQAAGFLGGLDILITNAGGPPTGKFEDFGDADWQRAIEASLTSHIRLIRAALPHLRRSTAPAILTVTSLSVKQPIPNLILSNSIRAATVGLTKTLSQELGREGIRVNSILPGWTETERITSLMADRATRSGRTPEEESKLQAASVPLGRIGSPEEFASAAVFLVSPAASYVNGVMLQVDGGAYGGLF